MFALEWCDFCWSVRKLFKALDVPYRSIDLDSVAYQQDNWGGEIRLALRECVQASTIPQIFVGGEHLGGCTDAFDAFKQGRLQDLLQTNGIAYRRKRAVGPVLVAAEVAAPALIEKLLAHVAYVAVMFN